MKLFVYLSDILGRQVFDSHDRYIGKLCDISMRMSDEVYPRTAGLIISRGVFNKEYGHVDMEDVSEIKKMFKLKVPSNKIIFEKAHRKYDFTLCNDILDQQVVDTDNQKVVRVNDVHLLRVDNRLYLAHVDVGLRALVRRLEWTSSVDKIVRFLSPKSPYLIREDFIPWKNTQVLTSGRYKNVLRLDIARKKLSQIPPTELAEIMEDLDIFEKLALFKSLSIPIQRKVFADLATQEKHDLVDQLDDKESANLLENIPADEATDLLLTLPKEKTFRLMKRMQTKKSKKLLKLLGFAKDSAGGLMTTEYLYVEKAALVEDAIKVIKDNLQYPGNIFHIYVVDQDHRLVGSTSLRQFFNENSKTPIMKTCYPRKIFVRTDDGMEEIALLLEKYKFSSIPVLNEDDVLQGVVTSDDIMEELISMAWTKYKEKLV